MKSVMLEIEYDRSAKPIILPQVDLVILALGSCGLYIHGPMGCGAN